MPTIDLASKLEDGSTKTIKFTYSGGVPGEAGPRGALLKLLMAIVEGDNPTIESLLDEKSRQMPRASVPPGDMEVILGEPTIEGHFTIVPCETKAEGQSINLPFHLFQENGAWKVDMATSVEKMMSGMMTQLGDVMQQAMGGVEEGMSKMMEGLGAAMGQGFGGDSTKQLGAPPAPDAPRNRHSGGNGRN